MTDRNDGRPRHSASHIHCAVPFFCARSGTEGEGRVAVRGRVTGFGGEWVVRSAGVRRRCVGERKCSGSARRCAGAGADLRRGMDCEVGEECIAQPAGVRLGCGDVAGGLGKGVSPCGGGGSRSSVGNVLCGRRACIVAAMGSGSVRGREQIFDGECVVWSAGVHRRCEGSGSVREGGEKMLGQCASLCGAGADLRREWAVRVAGLTHFRRSGSRVRVLLYIRLPCPRREIAAMGPKDAPCEHPSPAE